MFPTTIAILCRNPLKLEYLRDPIWVLSFILFMKMISLMQPLPCKPHLFADDTCLAITSSSIYDLKNRCNSELQHLYIPGAVPINYK